MTLHDDMHSTVMAHLRWARKAGLSVRDCVKAIGYQGKPILVWDDVYSLYCGEWLGMEREAA